MFTFTEAGYQLFRNRGRSALMVCVSLLLCGCIAFYLGNITRSRQALDSISENTPAIVNISNLDGDTLENLTIPTVYTDILQQNWDVKDVLATSQAAGAYSPEARLEEPRFFNGGDTSVLGVNCLRAVGEVDPKHITFLEGYDPGFLEGAEPLCIISEDYAEKFGLALGDELPLLLYLKKYTSMRWPKYFPVYDDSWGGEDYEFPAEKTLRIAGIYTHKLNPARKADLYLPVQWLRQEMEAPDLPVRDYHYGSLALFTYSNFQCALSDSMGLNDFKAAIESWGFDVPYYTGHDYYDHSRGSSVYMDDEDFIKTAEKLGETIRQYRAFMIPFFLVVVLLVTLAVILVLRGCRRDMAVSCSLGRPKVLIGAVHLLAALGAQALGCLLALPLMAGPAGLGLGTGMAICGAFLLCALIGDVLALCSLLRFDALALLTRTD